MSLVITRATTSDDRDAVFRLRYTVIVEEARQPSALADHHFRFLEEPWDATARFLVARHGDTVVGAWRVNLASDMEPGEETEFFATARFPDARPHTVAYTAPPLIASGFRNSTIATRLALAAFQMNLEEGITHDFVACPLEHESFFKDLGYRPYLGRKTDDAGGDVLPMVLILRDRDFLTLMHSPLLQVLNDDASFSGRPGPR